jgi:outer membrane protein OmpA-like peptidoglycan-associated protein
MTSTKRFLRHPLAAAIPLLAFLPGCAVDPHTGAQSIVGVKVSDDPCARTNTVIGGVVGAATGVAVASQLGKSTDAKVLGGLAGGGIGAAIGYGMDQRRCALFAIAREHNAEVSVNAVIVPRGDLPAAANVAAATLPATGSATPFSAGSDTAAAGLSVSVRDAGHQFAPGSDKLGPEAESLFRQMADQYAYARQQARLTPAATDDDRAAVEALKTKRILLVGHTDDSGNSADNANLSERRAAAVARLFQQEGVPAANLFFQGAGETLPIADNHTEAGRAANRRVEIVDVGDDAAFRKYLATRRQSLQYYRGSEVAAAEPVPAAPEPASKGKARPKAKEAPRGANYIDFGGVPAASLPVSTDFGTGTVGTPGTPAAGATNANRPIVPTCSADRPRVANGVKALATQKDLPTSDYVPGLYNTSWSDTVNGNLIGLTNVDVLRDGGAAATRPTLFVWKNYNPKKKMPPADFQVAPEVNVYRGSNAILYRVFVSGPMKCMDVLFPYTDTGESRASSLFYERQSNMYVSSFELKSLSGSQGGQ